MTPCSQNTNILSIGIVRDLWNDHQPGLSQNANMANARTKRAKRPKNYLREWREHRKLTQEHLAALVGTSKSVISEIESMSKGMSDKWAHKLAPHLGIQPGWLLDYQPDDVPTDVIDLFRSISDEDKLQVRQILKTFRRRKA